MCLHLGVVLLVAFVSVSNCQLLIRLEKALDYGISTGVRDLNFLLGVAIARGQLKVMEKYKRNLNLTNFQNVQTKCDVLLSSVLESKDPLMLAVTADLWTLDPVLRTSPLFHSPTPTHSFTSSLTRTLSDHCLRSVLSECSLESDCLSAELSEQSHGYTLTHQLLYWLLFDQNCSRSEKTKALMRSVMDRLCSRMSLEHGYILAQGVPSEMQDLYLEQVVLCGILGHKSFLTLFNQNLLTSLQTEEGCFAPRGYRACEQHLTGIGTAALTLFANHEHMIDAD